MSTDNEALLSIRSRGKVWVMEIRKQREADTGEISGNRQEKEPKTELISPNFATEYFSSLLCSPNHTTSIYKTVTYHSLIVLLVTESETHIGIRFQNFLHPVLSKHYYMLAEKAMAPHSSARAWKIPRMEEPGRLRSMGSLRARHDWATSLSLFTFTHWRRRWQPTPVFLLGESQGWGSLVGWHLWGHTESDTTEVT